MGLSEIHAHSGNTLFAGYGGDLRRLSGKGRYLRANHAAAANTNKIPPQCLVLFSTIGNTTFVW